MGKYMFHTTYTGKGLAGLLKEGGSRRRQALTDTIEAMGGSVEGLYYAFGETDPLHHLGRRGNAPGVPFRQGMGQVQGRSG